MNDRQKQRIIAAARELARQRPEPYVPPDFPAVPQSAQSGTPDEYVAGLDTAPPPRDWSAYYVEQRMAQLLEQERGFMLKYITELLGEVLGETIADLHDEHQKELDAERERHKAELLQFQKTLNELTIACSKLLGAEQHKAVLDLAALPVHSATN